MHSWNENPVGINGFSEFKISGFNEKEQGKDAHYKNVPLVIAPGQEEAYLNDLAKKKSTSAKPKPEQTQPEAEQTEKVETEEPQPVISPEKNRPGEQQTEQVNTNGWSGLLGTLGLDGMGDITGNLGYVMAMLPDILL